MKNLKCFSLVIILSAFSQVGANTRASRPTSRPSNPRAARPDAPYIVPKKSEEEKTLCIDNLTVKEKADIKNAEIDYLSVNKEDADCIYASKIDTGVLEVDCITTSKIEASDFVSTCDLIVDCNIYMRDTQVNSPEVGVIFKEGVPFVHNFGPGQDNTFVGKNAGNLTMSGNKNSGFGQDALHSNTTGLNNNAFGQGALFSNTTGYNNNAFGQDALHSNTTGLNNNAFGQSALEINTTGDNNNAFGYLALYNNTTGDNNNAFGLTALAINTTGRNNNAFGYQALYSNTTGMDNNAFGYQALNDNTTGMNNNAFGKNALVNNTTGDNNIAIGGSAGSELTTGDNNIEIANVGVAGESGTIRIGTYGNHTRAFMSGIHDVIPAGADQRPVVVDENDQLGTTDCLMVSKIEVIDIIGTGIEDHLIIGGSDVYVDGNGKLGTPISSIRFKQNIVDLQDITNLLLQLRPVSFNYKPSVDPDESADFGLIAEEVVSLFPELVVLDNQGLPLSVRYDKLSVLLLQEVKKLAARVAALEACTYCGLN